MGFLAFQPFFQRKLKDPDVTGADSSMGGRLTEQKKIGLEKFMAIAAESHHGSPIVQVISKQ